MTALLPKLWSKCRATLSETWSQALSDHWDTAIRGSSALRAGLVRACLDESEVELGVTSLTLLLDIEKFYDSVSLLMLLRLARKVGYPAALISLE
eukprot:8739219-Pyramimonas_sp.AAC.1